MFLSRLMMGAVSLVYTLPPSVHLNRLPLYVFHSPCSSSLFATLTHSLSLDKNHVHPFVPLFLQEALQPATTRLNLLLENTSRLVQNGARRRWRQRLWSLPKINTDSICIVSILLCEIKRLEFRVNVFSDWTVKADSLCFRLCQLNSFSFFSKLSPKESFSFPSWICGVGERQEIESHKIWGLFHEKWWINQRRFSGWSFSSFFCNVAKGVTHEPIKPATIWDNENLTAGGQGHWSPKGQWSGLLKVPRCATPSPSSILEQVSAGGNMDRATKKKSPSENQKRIRASRIFNHNFHDEPTAFRGLRSGCDKMNWTQTL